MRQALLLYAAQAHALIKSAPTRLTKTRAAPQGWEDLSNGKGACCVRRLTPPRGGPKPPPGAECSVRWTAWLAEKQGTWWCRGERIGALQPNSTLEFTLGGGSGEATRAWDACVATMAVDDRVEILAGPDWAFGDGAEPHLRCLLPMMILYIPNANTPVPPIASAMDESPDLGRLRPYFGMR